MKRAPEAIVMLGLAFGGLDAAAAPDCSAWTLDGYALGMTGDAVLAVRSVTLHVKGQAQVVQPGKLHGVIVIDDAGRLEKWDVGYDDLAAEPLRTQLTARLGAPASDVTGTLMEEESLTVRQRRTIWRDAACDAAILVYENTAAGGRNGGSVRATLTRASSLPKGLIESTSIVPAGPPAGAVRSAGGS